MIHVDEEPEPPQIAFRVIYLINVLVVLYVFVVPKDASAKTVDTGGSSSGIGNLSNANKWTGVKTRLADNDHSHAPAADNDQSHAAPADHDHNHAPADNDPSHARADAAVDIESQAVPTSDGSNNPAATTTYSTTSSGEEAQADSSQTPNTASQDISSPVESDSSVSTISQMRDRPSEP